MSEVTFTSWGSANSIGPSCQVLQFGSFRVGVDYGAGNGDDDKEPQYDGPLDALLLTHAHRDHTGMVPRALARPDWKGTKCWATYETIQLAKWIWADELKIARQEGRTLPFYEQDAVRAENRIQLLKPGRTVFLNDELAVTPYRAGHILGAVWLLFRYHGKFYAVTGDISLRSHDFVDGADVQEFPSIAALIRESTYVGQYPAGERDDVKISLVNSVLDVLDQGGSVVIPTLSIDRMPEVYTTLLEGGVESAYPLWVVGGAKPAQIYADYAPGARVLGTMPRFDNYRHQMDVMKSGEPVVILASSGMVVPNTPSYDWALSVLDDENSAIFMVNWQDPCKPGGIILNGKDGERLDLPGGPRKRCLVKRFDFSTHAKEDEMAEMEKRLNPGQVIHVHGEDKNIQAFINATEGKYPYRIKAEVGKVIPL